MPVLDHRREARADLEAQAEVFVLDGSGPHRACAPAKALAVKVWPRLPKA